MGSRRARVTRGCRLLTGLAVVATTLALTATGGAASSTDNVDVSVVGMLRPGIFTVDTDHDITYTLRFRNPSDSNFVWDAPTGFTPPAGTTLVSKTNASGFTLAPGETKDATLTVHVPVLPNGARLRVTPHVSSGGNPWAIDDPGYVDYVVTNSTVDPATAISITSVQTSTWPNLTVSGAVTTSGGAYAGQSVTLWQRVGTTTSKAATVTTDSTGRMSRVVHPTGATTYWWGAGAVTSPQRTTQVRPLLSSAASTATPTVKHASVISGRTTPAAAGGPVQLQQLSGTTWSTIRSTTVAASSATTVGGGSPYSFSLTQTTAGTRRYRVLVPANHGRLAVNGPTLTVRWVS